MVFPRRYLLVNGYSVLHLAIQTSIGARDMSDTRLERVSFDAMKRRCYNPNADQYPHYGGRGIKVCEQWINSFSNFYNDMGSRPSRKHTLDRIDNNKDYSPDNCRWATRKEQANNRRSSKWVTIEGVTRTLQQWIDGSGIKTTTVFQRLTYGWTIKQALELERRVK